MSSDFSNSTPSCGWQRSSQVVWGWAGSPPLLILAACEPYTNKDKSNCDQAKSSCISQRSHTATTLDTTRETKEPTHKVYMKLVKESSLSDSIAGCHTLIIQIDQDNNIVRVSWQYIPIVGLINPKSILNGPRTNETRRYLGPKHKLMCKEWDLRLSYNGVLASRVDGGALLLYGGELLGKVFNYLLAHVGIGLAWLI